MSVHDFLNKNISLLISGIISKLDTEFNSHDFIKGFSKIFEEDYINFLYNYKGKGAFKTVHSQIGKFLSLKKTALGIQKMEKVKDEHIFEEEDKIQAWKKI